MNNSHRSAHVSETGSTFEAPELTLIGEAGTVIQGFFGVGWDGPNGMTEPLFEFAQDEVD